MFVRRLAVAALWAGFALPFVPAAHAADFRVDNSVYADGSQQPQSRGVTIFHARLAYDFIADPPEIVIFDKPNRCFMLLDLNRHVRTVVSIDDLKLFIDNAKKKLATYNNPSDRWLANPTFDRTFDPSTGQLGLRGSEMSYGAVLQPTGPEIAAEYRDFSDWSSQLNYLLNTHARPPFARLVLNDALQKNQGIAKEVTLTTSFGGQTQTITSRHELSGSLDASDQNRVTEAGDDLRSFQYVPPREYIGK